MMSVRRLSTGDEDLLERFLASHRDSSMTLRSNARRAGLAYSGKPFQGVYVAAISQGEIAGVVAHYWRGMLIVQAPRQVEELARAAVAESGRPVTGFMGPVVQVTRARAALELQDAATTMDQPDVLYGLALSELLVPKVRERDSIEVRAPRPGERESLIAWRVAYDIELLGATDSEATRERATFFLDEQIAHGKAWVAVQAGRLVSLSAFNAVLPDIVQLGGIYTPPAFRRHGYATIAVGASLVAARERGATRAVLFTSNPNAARCYEALGFRRIGDFALILLR